MGRTVTLGVLEQVRIASPCSMRWEEMAPVDGGGPDRVRHCGACDLNVYNLSGMSRNEAEALVRSRAATGERLCAQLRIRADGTVLTRDCPVGLRAARLHLARAFSRLAAAAALLLAGAVLARSRDRSNPPQGLARVQPFASLCEWVRRPSQVAVPVQTIRGDVILGKMLVPPAPSPPGANP